MEILASGQKPTEIDWQSLSNHLKNADDDELPEIDYLLWQEIDLACSQDPLYWLQNFTATENPHYEKQNLPFTAPFPRKPYFKPLFQAFMTHRRLFTPKTREMMTSWCAMGFATSRAQWHGALVIVQTDSEKKAEELVGYGACLHRNQPAELRKIHPLLREPSKTEINWKAGGRILGIPKGEDKVRLYHPTIYIMDEAAFLPEAEACFNTAHPVSHQIIAISSAGPGWFGDQCAR